MQTTYNIKSVKSLEDAQDMRVIRNECKDFMTRNTSYITEEDQEKWYNSLDLNDIEMYLMYACYDGVAFADVAFGYIKFDGDEIYLTGGVSEYYRGQGLGRKMFSYLLDRAKVFDRKITLEVLNDNEKAYNLYLSLGFVPLYGDDRVTKMEYVDDTTI